MPATPIGVPGDYNSNGIVDAADYVFWRERLGQSTTLPNEVSGVTPGSVTNEDYGAWRARFGRTSGSGSGAFVAAAVPEPSNWVGAGLLLVFFLAGTRVVVRRAADRSGRRFGGYQGRKSPSIGASWKCLDGSD